MTTYLLTYEHESGERMTVARYISLWVATEDAQDQARKYGTTMTVRKADGAPVYVWQA